METVIPGIGSRIDGFLTEMETLGFSGAIVVAQNGSVLLAKGYGLANRETRRPTTTTDVFTVGSITKQFTGAAIVKLESERTLSVTDAISKYFPGVPEDKQGITLHHLLTHSSGLTDLEGFGDFDPVSSETIVQLALASELAFEPGEGYEYTNLGYSLLGVIVEQVTGQSYEEHIRDSLLVPAGMLQTGYVLPEWESVRIAHGYRDGEPWGTILDKPMGPDGPYWILRANGGIHSTAWDMLQWLEVVKGNRVLSADAHRKWLAPHVDEGDGDSFYGYGWVRWDTDHGPMIAHNGGNGVFSADFFYLLEPDLFFFIEGNSSVIEATSLREDLFDLAFDEEYEPPALSEVATDIDPVLVASRTGIYADAAGARLELRADDVRLIARALDQPAMGALLGMTVENSEMFRGHTEKARTLLNRLLANDARAFDEIIAEPAREARNSETMLARLAEWETTFGPLQSARVMGSTIPLPRPGLDAEIVASTWALIRLRDTSFVLELLWKANGGYYGTAIGPESDTITATLLPLGEDRFQGPLRRFDRQTPLVEFSAEGDDTCVLILEFRGCK